MILLHVGLGKTATTTLQRHVFPELTRIHPDIIYNKKGVMKMLTKSTYCSLTEEEVCYVRNEVSDGKWLLSLEDLVGWNPRDWEGSADLLLSIFGPKVQVLITVRKTREYLRSVFQQWVHQGNIKPPERFFVPSVSYDLVERKPLKWRLEHFDVDSFDLYRLLHIYEERFDVVRMVSMERIRQFEFLKAPFALSEYTVRRLQVFFDQAPRSNRAYSSLGMSLTFARESIFNSIGARTRGTDDRDPIEICRRFDDSFRYSPLHAPFQSLKFLEKLKQAPRRAVLRWTQLARGFVPSWRKFIQRGLDKILPYTEYRFPDAVYRNYELEKSNDDLVSRLSGDGSIEHRTELL